MRLFAMGRRTIGQSSPAQSYPNSQANNITKQYICIHTHGCMRFFRHGPAHNRAISSNQNSHTIRKARQRTQVKCVKLQATFRHFLSRRTRSSLPPNEVWGAGYGLSFLHSIVRPPRHLGRIFRLLPHQMCVFIPICRGGSTAGSLSNPYQHQNCTSDAAAVGAVVKCAVA
jgi:hypothetical protein